MFGGNLGNEVAQAMACAERAERAANGPQHYTVCVPTRATEDKHIGNAARLVAAALKRGKNGYDFRTARPYWIGQVGGVELVAWPRLNGTYSLAENILGHLPNEDAWLAGEIAGRALEILLAK